MNTIVFAAGDALPRRDNVVAYPRDRVLRERLTADQVFRRVRVAARVAGCNLQQVDRVVLRAAEHLDRGASAHDAIEQASSYARALARENPRDRA